MILTEYDLKLIGRREHPKYLWKNKSIVWKPGWKIKRKLKGSLKIR